MRKSIAVLALALLLFAGCSSYHYTDPSGREFKIQEFYEAKDTKITVTKTSVPFLYETTTITVTVKTRHPVLVGLARIAAMIGLKGVI